MEYVIYSHDIYIYDTICIHVIDNIYIYISICICIYTHTCSFFQVLPVISPFLFYLCPNTRSSVMKRPRNAPAPKGGQVLQGIGNAAKTRRDPRWWFQDVSSIFLNLYPYLWR